MKNKKHLGYSVVVWTAYSEWCLGRSFRGYLNTLKNLGLINIVVSATGRKKRGVRARISLNDIPASVVIERVDEQLMLIENM